MNAGRSMKTLTPFIVDGENQISDIVDDPACHFLAAPGFEVRDGFGTAYNLGNSLFSCARDEAVRKQAVPGRLWHWFPKTGRFHIGFVLVDDPDRTFSFAFNVQRRPWFRVRTARADGLRHLYFTPGAYDLEYAQTFEMVFDGDGSRQAVEGLVFLEADPVARCAGIEPVQVVRHPAPVEPAPFPEFELVNPGGFALANEWLQVWVPGADSASLRMMMGRRALPFSADGNGGVEVLVTTPAHQRRTRIRPAQDAADGSSPECDLLRLDEAADAQSVQVRDARHAWRIRIDNTGFFVERDGARSWHLQPVMEDARGIFSWKHDPIVVVGCSPLTACLEMGFRHRDWRHATRLRIVRGSSRLELEHLLEVPADVPFGFIRQYGLRIRGGKGSPTSGTAGIRPDGGLVPLSAFRACVHTEKDTDGPSACLTHTLLWRGAQFTVQEMTRSAPILLAADAGELLLSLLPPADGVRLDSDEEYRMRNQFFIEKGMYKLRGGMARRHFTCLQTVAPEEADVRRYEAGRLDEPPFLHVPILQQGLRAIVNAAMTRRKGYREAVQHWRDQYLANRDAVRAYGFFSYGDWFGERVNNWGNNEYDTAYGFLANFLATGDPELRKLGFAAARHQMDVDSHHGRHDLAGWQIAHAMAHGGRYFPDEYRVGAYSHGGVNVAHNWVEGMLLYGRLSGDPRAAEIAGKLLDDLSCPESLRNWAYTNGRNAGWHLIHLCAGYQYLRRRRDLEAAATLVEKILVRQRRDGGFKRVLHSDHCGCYPKHVGSVSFMMGYLMAGLKHFHAITQDRRVERAIVRLAHSVVSEMWDSTRRTFRYTACPKSKPMDSAMLLEGLLYACTLDPSSPSHAVLWKREWRRLAARTVPTRIVQGDLVYGDSACGKALSQYLRTLIDAQPG